MLCSLLFVGTVLAMALAALMNRRHDIDEARSGWGYWNKAWEGAFDRAEECARMARRKRDAEL
jgi:hypothetical protein